MKTIGNLVVFFISCATRMIVNGAMNYGASSYNNYGKQRVVGLARTKLYIFMH